MAEVKEGSLAQCWQDYKVTMTQNYALFKGRASRGEFWRFVAVNVGIALMIMLIEEGIDGGTFSVASDIYSALTLIPSIAISVRRLHDINKSGWMYLLNFIPLLGTLWLLYLYVQPGHSGSNQYGEDPLA